MPKLLEPIVTNAAYFFIGVGIVWLAVAFLAASPLILWPVVACVAGGVMLRQMPSYRFTWAWVVSSAALGFVISAYEVYAWSGFLGGAYSALAAGALVGFAVFAVVHVLLFYAGTSKPSIEKEET